MSEIKQDENIEIDDTTLKYRVRVNNEIYPSFVENRNIKNVITVSPSNVSYKTNIKINRMEKQEIWDIPLSKSVLNSTCIENMSDLGIDISNIKFSQDHLDAEKVYNNGAGLKGALTLNKLCMDSMLGLPCPYVEGATAGFSYNPLISLCESVELKWGANAIPQTSYFNDHLLDAYSRLYDPEMLKKFDRTLIPDEINDYTLMGKFFTMNKYVGNEAQSMKKIHRGEQTSLTEIASNPKNPFGIHNKMYKATTNTFTKAIASPNYYFDGVGFLATSATTALHKITVNGFTFPANCTQADYEKSGISPFSAFFYYNKDNTNSFKILIGETTITNTTGTVPEPAGQSLTQHLSWKGLVASLPCDELTQFNKNNSFHNCSQLTITKNWRTNPYEILKFCLPYDAPLTKCVSSAGNALVAKNYPCLKDLVFDVKLSNQAIRMKQITIPQELKVAKESTLSFLDRIAYRHPLSSQIGSWQGSTPLPFYLNGENFSRVPYATMIFGTSRNTSSKADMLNKSGCNRVMIESLRFKLDGNDPVMTSFNKHDLMRISKQNGLENYGIDFLKGAPLLAQNVYTYDNGTDVYIPQTMSSIHNSDATVKNVQNGNVVLLRWGVNIPTPGLTGSVGGLQSVLTIDGTASNEGTPLNGDGVDETNGHFDLHVIHFYEREIVIAQDGFATVVNSLFSRNDYVQALNIWQKKVNSGKLYINAHSLRGGNFFSSVVDKISSVLPKILPMIKKGIDFYNGNKDAIHSGVDAVKSIANGNSDQGISQGRRALGDLLRQ